MKSQKRCQKVNIMGSHVSQLIDEEKINWVRPHELVYNPDLRKQQLLLLPKFARKLQLCYQTNRFSSISYFWLRARAHDPEKDFAFASLTREVKTSRSKAELLQEGIFFLIHLFAKDVSVMKKLEIKKTKPTFIILFLKVEY